MYNCSSNDPLYNCPNDDPSMSPIVNVPDEDSVHSASVSHAHVSDDDDLTLFESDENNESIAGDSGE